MKNTVLSPHTIIATGSSCRWVHRAVHLHAGVHAYTEMFHSPLLNLSLFLFYGLLSQQEQASKKRERVMSETGTELPKQEKKRPKASQQPEELEEPKQFTPFDYSKSNFKVFAGKIWISCSRVLRAVENVASWALRRLRVNV